jgi:fructose-1,6-bisphosphatase/inositol monophosphatase family enzyme
MPVSTPFAPRLWLPDDAKQTLSGMRPGEIAAILTLLRTVSEAEIMPKWRHLTASDVRTKSGPQDPVTVADEAAERALAAGLKSLFPDDAIIGEEAVAKDRSLLNCLKQPGRLWVIDPIDGTSNFADGLPLFGVMLALIEQDEILAGFIHDPIGDDTAVATAGNGAWMVSRDGRKRRLHVAQSAPVAEMTGSLSWRFMPQPMRGKILSRLDRLAGVTDFRCAAHQYRLIADGRCHVQLFRRLYPWDHAAGFLLHREAGGYGRQFDGGEYFPSEINGGLLLAPDEASWRALAEVFLQ